jgi:putative PIN family toxin of toxin-antitoxin system
MKIVIDTNVFLSALFSRRGASYLLVEWLLREFSHGRQHNVISNTLVTEFDDVLLRQKHIAMCTPLNRRDIERFIDGLCLISYHQRINFLWRPFLRDSNDDMVLEVAFNAKAEYIVTHNIKDFHGVEERFDIRVITPQRFLKEIGVL